MPSYLQRLLLRMLVPLISLCGVNQLSAQVEVWLTDPSASARFQKQTTILSFRPASADQATSIRVDSSQTFQSIDGFGFCLTGGSAANLIRMSRTERTALLMELFAADSTNIGVSYLRLSIGASDLNDHVFSYDDLPTGQTDPELKKFSVAPDRADVVPIMKEILAIYPDLKILASPWSPPAWMKTTGDTRGGSLKPEYFASYAQYFVKYIEAMRAENIRIDAVTIQNEPLNPNNNPSLFMPASQQAAFLKHHLGPAFHASNLTTKIILYDHNADRPDYPLSILGDPDAKKYADGSAFHLYGGRIEALTAVHNAYPDKNIYFTEQWIGAPGNLGGDLSFHVGSLIIGATRNWSRTVLEWNLAADPGQNPHTDRGGCDRCLGAMTIDGNKTPRNPAYYIIAHAAKFVRPGSIRIASNLPASLPNVAFRAPNGKKVLIVLNRGPSTQTFNIVSEGMQTSPSLPAGAVGTYVW